MDKVTQAERKLSGLCLECGNTNAQEKYYLSCPFAIPGNCLIDTPDTCLDKIAFFKKYPIGTQEDCFYAG